MGWRPRKRNGFGTVLQPLFQQQGGGGTVQSAGAITPQTELFGGRPAAAVLIHPGQRQAQGLSEAEAIAATVLGLGSGTLLGIQGQPHHEGLHRPQANQSL
jgi:hypothetical protein